MRENVKNSFSWKQASKLGCILYTVVHYTQVNTVNLIKVKHNAIGKTLSFLSNFLTLATQLKQENEIYIPFYF